MTKNGFFLIKLGYLSNENIFLKIHNAFSPLYHDLLFGSLHREVAVPSFPYIIYEIIILYTWLYYIIIIIIFFVVIIIIITSKVTHNQVHSYWVNLLQQIFKPVA